MALPIFIVGSAMSLFACIGLLAAKMVGLTGRRPRREDAAPPRPQARASGSAALGRPRRKRPTVSVVVPALNEARNIGWVLSRLPSWVTEVVLVDGLSTDGTEDVAREFVTDLVVVRQSRLGKGAALRAGFAAATGDIIVMIDADGSTDPREMDRFVQALMDGAEFVKGSRHVRGGGSEDWTRIRHAGNQGFVWLVNLIYGSRFTDLCYGYCAFWRYTLDALALSADGFEIETQLALNAVKAGLEIREVGSLELPRRAGTSNLRAFRDGRRVLSTIMNERPGRDSRRAAERTQIGIIVELPATEAVNATQAAAPAVVYRAIELPAEFAVSLAS
jgi:Glycosyl transferase family 2